MIYFFCALLALALLCGKAEGVSGSIALAAIDIALVFAILFIWSAEQGLIP